jgi:hypothetical protein
MSICCTFFHLIWENSDPQGHITDARKVARMEQLFSIGNLVPNSIAWARPRVEKRKSPDRGASESIIYQHDVEARPLPRRAALGAVAAVVATATASAAAEASVLPEALDDVWEAIGGGPADLTFPQEFEGVFDVVSVLTSVEFPSGEDAVPDIEVVRRAEKEDLNAALKYRVSWVTNTRGDTVMDRRFNTAALLEAYTGLRLAEVASGIDWNPDNPNLLRLKLPGGTLAVTRVTRRSEEDSPAEARLSTSEFFEQLIETPGRQQPKVKASQCFTKYKWRSAAAAAAGGGPQIVATQVVSDYLTPYDEPGMYVRAGDKPVVVYTYKMTFIPVAA